MFKHFVFNILFDDPSDGAGGGALTVDDIENILSEPESEELEVSEEEPEEEPEDEAEPKKEEKEDKEEKEEKEIKLVDEEEEEIDKLVVPVAKKKILAKYPNLFKDFPYLEKAYYDDQKYKEILPTIEDAQEVIEKARALDGFESKLLSGDTVEVLTAVKNSDENAFNKIVDDYLPTLAKVDKPAFDRVLANVTSNIIAAMVREARTSKNEDLEKAALLVNQFAFGTSQYQPPKKMAKETDNTEQTKLQTERAQFEKERFTTAAEDLGARVQNVLKSTIDSHIDPKGAMTSYVKKHAIEEALSSLDKVIMADKQFGAQITRLWEQASKQNYSRESMQKIRSAFLSKARTVLPVVIKRTRNEAMSGLSKRSTEKKTSITSSGRQSTSSNSGKEDKSAIPKGMSTLDFFMKD